MEGLEKAANSLGLPGEGGEADWLGRLNHVIRVLQDKRKIVLDELAGPVEGEEYRVTESRSASRSYNTAAIISGFLASGYSLHDLMAMDAVRLSWRWAQLRRAAEMANVDLHIAHYEVDDAGEVDGPMIGEVWSSRWNVEGKQ